MLGVDHVLFQFDDVISVVTCNKVWTPDPSTQVLRQHCCNLKECVRFTLRALVVSTDTAGVCDRYLQLPLKSSFRYKPVSHVSSL